MTVNEIDVTPFKEATAGVYEKLGYGELRDELQAIANVALLDNVARRAGPAPAGSTRRGLSPCSSASGRSSLRSAFALLAIITGLVFVASIMRFFGHPLIWSVDLAQLLFIWLCMLGATRAMREKIASRHGDAWSSASATSTTSGWRWPAR